MSLAVDRQRWRRLVVSLFLISGGVWLGVSAAWPQEGKAPVSARKGVDFSAFAQVRYNHYLREGIDTFAVRRVRLSFAASILDDLDFKVQLEQTKQTSLVEAYLSFHFGNWAEIRAGQFKIPFSYENLKSASEQDFINRSSVVENLCPGRDIGAQGRDVGVIGQVRSTVFEATLGLFNGSGINRLDTDDHKDKAFRLTFSPWRNLTVGGSWYEGLWPESESSVSRLRRRRGLEGQWHSNFLALAAEYISAVNYDQEAEGWVVQASLLLRRGQIQPVLRFESLDGDKTLPDDAEKVLTYGANIHLASRTKLQFNLESHRPQGAKQRQNIYLFQFQIGF